MCAYQKYCQLIGLKNISTIDPQQSAPKFRILKFLRSLVSCSFPRLIQTLKCMKIYIIPRKMFFVDQQKTTVGTNNANILSINCFVFVSYENFCGFWLARVINCYQTATLKFRVQKELKSSQSEGSFLHWDEVVVLEGLFFHLELSVLFSDLFFL